MFLGPYLDLAPSFFLTKLLVPHGVHGSPVLFLPGRTESFLLSCPLSYLGYSFEKKNIKYKSIKYK